MSFALAITQPRPVSRSISTMPPLILEDIRGILHLQSHTIEYVWLSNDRPNIHLMVTEMQHSFSSKQDLDRFIKFDHANSPGDTPSCPPKFMIFTNKQKEAENVAKKFWRDLPEELHYMVVWFHSGMSTQYKEETMALQVTPGQTLLGL